MSCRRSSRFWGLGCPKIFHEIEDSLAVPPAGGTTNYVFGAGSKLRACAVKLEWGKKMPNKRTAKLILGTAIYALGSGTTLLLLDTPLSRVAISVAISAPLFAFGSWKFGLVK